MRVDCKIESVLEKFSVYPSKLCIMLNIAGPGLMELYLIATRDHGYNFLKSTESQLTI